MNQHNNIVNHITNKLAVDCGSLYPTKYNDFVPELTVMKP